MGDEYDYYYDNYDNYTNDTDGSISAMWAAAHAIDKASVWFSLITGIPGNIFIFLTMHSLPKSVAAFHFKLLSLMDLIALLLQLSIRPFDWYNVVLITSNEVNFGWKIYFNLTYFTGIYANWVLVYIAVERLIALRYPTQASTYLTLPRAKANAVLTALLIYSFSIIVIVKINYFGIAWLVVFTTFYTAFPMFLVFIVIWLLLGTLGERMRQKKVLEKEAKDHHHHHHHNKNGHKSSASATPIGTPTLPTTKSVPSMSKSSSGLTKHQGGHHGEMHKHDPMSTSVPNINVGFTGSTFCFTTKPRPPGTGSNTPDTDAEPPEVLSQRAKERKDLERCYTYMMLVTSIVFVCLTMSYTVMEYIYVTDDKEMTDIFNERQAKMFLMMMVGNALMYIEHACNFYIFFVSCWKFRQQFMKVITKKLKRTQPPPPPNDCQAEEEEDQRKNFV